MLMQPHHQSYYDYFNEKHSRARRSKANRRMNIYVAISKMRDKKCSVREFHYFFMKLKTFIDESNNGNKSNHDDEMLMSSERARPSIFDLLGDLPDSSQILERKSHPWRNYK